MFDLRTAIDVGRGSKHGSVSDSAAVDLIPEETVPDRPHRYKKGEHPDYPKLGREKCVLCRSPLSATRVSDQVFAHDCTNTRCKRYRLACPNHGATCILRRVATHASLPPCPYKHEGCWVYQSQRGRVVQLICCGPATRSGYTYCGASYRKWIGPKPVVKPGGGNDKDRTRYILLHAFATNRERGLTLKEAVEVSGLTLNQVQSCSTRLRTNSKKLLVFAGQVCDYETCRDVNIFKIVDDGYNWVMFHSERGTFNYGSNQEELEGSIYQEEVEDDQGDEHERQEA